MGPARASGWGTTACAPTNHANAQKHEKKCLFFRADPLFFCQRGPFWGPFWLSNYYVSRKWFSLSALQGLKKRRFFKKNRPRFCGGDGPIHISPAREWQDSQNNDESAAEAEQTRHGSQCPWHLTQALNGPARIFIPNDYSN
jgi:hypothetical protein